MTGMYFRDQQGFAYFFPDDMPGTLFVGCAGSDWRKLAIGDRTFACGTLTSAMYDRLRSECVSHGTVELEA